MSGGRFDYIQYRFQEIVETIEYEIEHNEEFNQETIEEFKKGVDLINQAHVYLQRIDWLLSGDDSEDSFHERLLDDLSKIIKIAQ